MNETDQPRYSCPIVLKADFPIVYAIYIKYHYVKYAGLL